MIPRPVFTHAIAAQELLGELRGPFRLGHGGPGGWWLVGEPRLHLEENVLVPDVAGWRRERIPQLPRAASTSLAPDWMCEVLPPSTTPVDRERKMPLCGRAGVGHSCRVDPLARVLEVYGWVKQGVYTG